MTERPAIKGYLYVLGSILLVTLAQLAMKWGVMQLPAWQASLDIMLAHPVPLLVITAGVGCYALSLLCWLAALHFTPLNIAYPLAQHQLCACLPAGGQHTELCRTAGAGQGGGSDLHPAGGRAGGDKTGGQEAQRPLTHHGLARYPPCARAASSALFL
ncbi:4-amino-4-deoxy-L-arabinose-phosphoundecaprenol flippase subunit ArnF [Aeromonas salmonicida subsp. masoucida NBRC 13784]|nr:4-amino-4-deoxy-L-arabinose-phosphoundecaprenol flippase subunit ArnF [Aeromonas salmonicida subsp. masoucida NBRC 13784]